MSIPSAGGEAVELDLDQQGVEVAELVIGQQAESSPLNGPPPKPKSVSEQSVEGLVVTSPLDGLEESSAPQGLGAGPAPAATAKAAPAVLAAPARRIAPSVSAKKASRASNPCVVAFWACQSSLQ